MNPVKCFECGEEITNDQDFAAVRSADGWKAAHGAHIKPGSELDGQRIFKMNPARAWVMNGAADVHRITQKAAE